MDLKFFIATAVSEIIEGTLEASEKTGKEVGIYSAGTKNQRHIEFDVAVVAHEKQKSGRSSRIGVLEIVRVGGSSQKETIGSTVSRIKFGLRIKDK